MSPPRYSSNKPPKVIKQVSFGREPVVEKKNEANIRQFVIFTIGIPGMGKTFFKDQFLDGFCKKNGLEIQTLSNDQIRQSEMDAFKLKNPEKSKDEIYEKTQKRTSIKFENDLRKALEKKSLKKQVVFIDKNHPPNGVEKTLSQISQLKNDDQQTKTIVLLPDFSTGHIPDYFIVKCFLRILERKAHPTLGNENPYHAAEILFNFVSYFRKFDFSKFSNTGIDQIIRINFVENPGFELPDEISEAVERCQAKKVFKTSMEIQNFVDIITKYRRFWGSAETSNSSPFGSSITEIMMHSMNLDNEDSSKNSNKSSPANKNPIYPTKNDPDSAKRQSP